MSDGRRRLKDGALDVPWNSQVAGGSVENMWVACGSRLFYLNDIVAMLYLNDSTVSHSSDASACPYESDPETSCC